ncbi:DnaJ-domain-containing protein [Gymnopus androsaceus JB14]|uniref:DnaJ-domain-containing protein n=1 Tax=Gymnopus androsaceus JB14 TaxID=1447944 RepID=A0A6A4IFU9_9AGAR|nr:DnaJ-domain-containing protein [Gymnopus androsaceus JB14]
MSKAASLANAYSVLGLQEGVSLEIVKNTYKQLALRTHPDKNPSPDATAEFQRVGEAYNILVKHLDTSRTPGRPSFAFSSADESSEHDYYEDEDEYDSEDEYERMMFYMYLFEQAMRDAQIRRGFGFSFSGSRGYPPHAPTPPPEPKKTPEKQAERLRRVREDQKAAEQRRKQEAINIRERKEHDRQQERLAAEERQKAKISQKKAKANAKRQKAEDAARAQREKVQNNRSTVFRAAREGNAQEVKKGIWENNVDAAGGEVVPGHEEFIVTMPEDSQETLLHIAARNGDSDLVEWLDTHSAEPEERDSQNRTAFHVAVQSGHPKVLSYFFKNHPPQESDYQQIYAAPKSKSVLSLSLESYEPEVVWMVLEQGLASSRDISDAWTWINSPSGRNSMMQCLWNASEKLDDIVGLLMSYGGFTPPPTPILPGKNSAIPQELPSSPASPSPSPPPRSKTRPQTKSRGRGRGRGRGA